MERQEEQKRAEAMAAQAEAASGTYWGYLGCKLVSIEEERTVVSIDVQEHHLNLLGIVHGGVLAGLLDNAMGAAAMAARPNEKVVTANLNVHYVAPMPRGTLICSVEILHRTRKSLTVYAEITDESGTLGTIGTATFRVT